jgi:hypothetical protein
MKIAYLLLAHNNRAHLQRLIAALSSGSPGSCSFFIHIDRKADIAPFLTLKGSNIHFVQERVSVFWGDFSQVEATLALVRTALADLCRFDRLVLLSGVDYPLRSASSIERFFESKPNAEFMNLVAMPADAVGKPISRLTTYRLRPGDKLIARVMQKLLMMAGVVPRTRDYKPVFRALAPYGGSTWWALSRAACDAILVFVAREADVVEFFKNTVCPDESFFQTILGNSDFKPRIVPNLTYTDWSGGGASPANISERHLALFQTMSSSATGDSYGGGEKLFARKFADEPADLVARLDRQISSQDSQDSQASLPQTRAV